MRDRVRDRARDRLLSASRDTTLVLPLLLLLRVVVARRSSAGSMRSSRRGCGRYYPTPTPTLTLLLPLLEVWPVLAAQFGRQAAEEMWLYDAFLLKFDEDPMRSGLGIHVDDDGLGLSINILLSSPDDFEGGGTWFEDSGETVTPKQAPRVVVVVVVVVVVL